MTLNPQDAAAFFARVSRELSEQTGEEPTIEQVTARAVEVVPACQECSLSLKLRRGQIETAASTSGKADRADALQYELREGPCVDAIWDAESHNVADAETDERWPRWGPAVAELGFRSILAIRLTFAGETIGALNLYSDEPRAFDDENVDLALVYTSHAATALSTARAVTGLQTALQSRHLIGVAQGILMQRFHIDMDTALEVLRRYSSHTNVKMREIAQMVVDDGQLPQLGGQPDLAGSDP